MKIVVLFFFRGMGHSFLGKKTSKITKKTDVLIIRSEIYFKTVLLSETSLGRFRLKSLGCSLKPILIINY